MRTLLPLVLALLLASSCQQSNTSTAAGKQPALVVEGDRGSFYLSREVPQAGDGTTILVDKVVLTGTKGYVAIHSDLAGRPGPLLGASSLLNEGTTRNVRVRLSQPLALSANVFPMLHVEDNANATYDFPGADAPARVGPAVVEVLVDLHVTQPAAQALQENLRSSGNPQLHHA